jgi:hypothetical protein
LYSPVALVETGVTGQFRVFPNPVLSNSAITIVVPAGLAGALRLSLVDIPGQMLAVKSLVLSASNNSFSWSLPRLAAGIYVIRLESADRHYYSRIAVFGN